MRKQALFIVGCLALALSACTTTHTNPDDPARDVSSERFRPPVGPGNGPGFPPPGPGHARPGEPGGWGPGGNWGGHFLQDTELPRCDRREFLKNIVLGDEGRRTDVEGVNIARIASSKGIPDCSLTHIRMQTLNDSAFISRVEVVYRNGRSDSIDLRDNNDRGGGSRRHGGRFMQGLFLQAGQSSGWIDMDDINTERHDRNGRPDGRCVDKVKVYGFSGGSTRRPTSINVDGYFFFGARR